MSAERKPAIVALVMSTVAFTVCFACWVINAVLVTYLVSNGAYAFDQAQVGWLMALPILTGALSRVLGLAHDEQMFTWLQGDTVLQQIPCAFTKEREVDIARFGSGHGHQILQ